MEDKDQMIDIVKPEQDFIFTGDILHPGRIKVTAADMEAAIAKFEAYDFEVYEEHDKDLAFNWNGEDPEIEGMEGANNEGN